jgi:hypothetical protein
MVPSAANIQQAMLLKLFLLATDKAHVNNGTIEYFHEMRGNLL